MYYTYGVCIYDIHCCHVPRPLTGRSTVTPGSQLPQTHTTMKYCGPQADSKALYSLKQMPAPDRAAPLCVLYFCMLPAKWLLPSQWFLLKARVRQALYTTCERHCMPAYTTHKLLAAQPLGAYACCCIKAALVHLLRKLPSLSGVACGAGGPVCLFTFDKLCNTNVGAADYIALANKFHTIVLSGVPIFTADIRNQAYRCAPQCCV